MKRRSIVLFAVVIVTVGLLWLYRDRPLRLGKGDLSSTVEPLVFGLEAADSTRDFGTRIEVKDHEARVFRISGGAEQLIVAKECVPDGYRCDSVALCGGGSFAVCSIQRIGDAAPDNEDKALVYTIPGLSHVATIPRLRGWYVASGIESDQVLALAEEARDENRVRVALIGAKDGRETFSQWLAGDRVSDGFGMCDDGKTFCVCLQKRIVVFRRVGGAIQSTDYELPANREVSSVVLSRLGQAAAISCYDGSVHSIDFRSRSWRSYTGLKHEYTPHCLAVTDAGDRVFVYQCANAPAGHIFLVPVGAEQSSGAIIVADLPSFHYGFRLSADEKSAAWTDRDGLKIWRQGGEAAGSVPIKKSH